MKLSLVLIACFSLPGVAFAQINKCVDTSGKTIYSQGPCPKGSKASSIATAAPKALATDPAGKAGDAPTTSGPKTLAEQEQEFRKRQQAQAELRKKEDERIAQAKNDEENCVAARRHLASIELGGRQSGINDKGERFFLDDAQIEQEKQRARQSISIFCK